MTKETQKRRVEIPEGSLEVGRGTAEVKTVAASNGTARRENPIPDRQQLVEAIVERDNMLAAYQRVVRNKGVAGVDGMTVIELKSYLRVHWARIREELLAGRYQPEPVLRVEIPKPGGKGMRELGIPTVMDRLIQQAMHQVLSSVFESGFSESSYGFRPRRSAHQAVLKAREYASKGKRWVVDMDLEKFFDRVNHDVLMSRIERKIKDKRVLSLTRQYLRAGVMMGGVVSVRTEGTPQGGPLSPLLSNILLDDLDKELEGRGHTFCRYADDCNIYVGSKRAAERVLASLTRFLSQRLRLKVNAKKSAVGRPWERTFLGYTMTANTIPRLKVAPASLVRFKNRLRPLFRRGRGQRVDHTLEQLTPILRGWIAYFRLAEVKTVIGTLDRWIRRHLRQIFWVQWKRRRTRARELMKRGINERLAWLVTYRHRGPWHHAGASHMSIALPNRFFDACGLISLQKQLEVYQCSL